MFKKESTKNNNNVNNNSHLSFSNLDDESIYKNDYQFEIYNPTEQKAFQITDMEKLPDSFHYLPHHQSNSAEYNYHPSLNNLYMNGVDNSGMTHISPADLSNTYFENGHSCAQCGKSFEKKFTLNSHIKNHHSGILFQCDICSTTFKRQHDLKRHHRSLHMNIKPFSCNVCKKGFSRMVLIIIQRMLLNDMLIVQNLRAGMGCLIEFYYNKIIT